MHTHTGLAVGVSNAGLSVGSPSAAAIAPSGQTALNTPPPAPPINWADYRPSPVMSVVIAASVAASAIHGYRRNEGSVGYALLWAGMGFLFPIIVPAVAIAEGFGEPEGADWAAKQRARAQQDWEMKQDAIAQSKKWK